MLDNTSKWSHARGNTVVPSRWQATAGNGRVNLHTFRSWGTSACASSSPTGWLYNNETSNAKFSWTDTDGYHHPSSSCMTQASALGLYYQNRIVGWVKLSRQWGGTWLDQMCCD